VHVAAARAERLDADVPPARDTEVLRQLDAAHARGQVRQVRAVADDDHLDRLALLPGHGFQEGPQLLGTVTHGQDDRAELQLRRTHRAHRSLLEARTDTRCSTVCTTAMAASRATPDLVKNSSPPMRSSTAASRISSDASTPPTSRWNRSAA